MIQNSGERTAAIKRVIERLGLDSIAAKHPNIQDVYVLEVCRVLEMDPSEVTQEQRRLGKALVYGRLYGSTADRLGVIETSIREGQF